MEETANNRAEIERKLTRMVRFIEQEGDEKSQEINDRTEEEYHIEKGNLIQVGRIKINQEYDKKLSLLKSQSQVEMSVITSKYRNQVLQTKRKEFAELFEQVYSRIKSDLTCVNRRWSVLQFLIMEALFKLLEGDVIIKCREVDAAIITKHISDLAEKYKLHTKHDIIISVDEEYIDDIILPGIVAITKNGKVQIDNTLDTRVEQILEFVTPLLSTIFYGTKKFRTSTST